MKKILVIVVTLVMAVCAYSEEKKAQITESKSVKNYKALLVGDEFGNIYYQENIDEKLPLASVTKMMTLLIAFDELKNGKINLKDEIEVPENIANIGGSRIWMKKGMTFTLEELIKASAIYSANNATQALAYHISHGDIDKFVKRMNKRLQKLSLDEYISYYTPTGLPPYMTKTKMDVGSARGLYLLSIEAEKNKNYMDMAGIKETKLKVGRIRNRNKLLGKNGIYGIKTGHHDTAGYNICIVSKQEDIKLFVIVLGGKNEKTRDSIVLENIKKFNNEYGFRKILDKKVPLTKIRVIAGQKNYVELYPDKNLEQIFKKESNIHVAIKKDYFTTAPVEKNEELGEYEVFVDDKKIISGKLQVKQGVSLYSPFK